MVDYEEPDGGRFFLNRWLPLREIFDFESSGKVLAYSAVVGVVAGLGAALFYYLLEKVKYFAQEYLMGYVPPVAGGEVPVGAIDTAVQLPEYWWAVLLVPTLGGLICGLLVYSFAPEAEGHGTDAMIRAFHHQRGEIRGRVPVIKSVASIITIGTGGSAGREGPIAQIGAGFGSFLATRLNLSDWERRMLMIAGAAGGIGAIFRAPLGGALFVVEVLYASTAIEFLAFGPSVVGAVVAYTVFTSIYGQGAIFHVPATAHPLSGPFAFHGPSELPYYVAFALICAVVGFLYVNVFYGLRDRFFHRLPIPRAVKTALGGLLLGLVALFFPHVMSGGYGWIQEALTGSEMVPLRLMVILVGAKILATSFTISSGGSGGVFAPSLFIGAMLGAAVGTVCNRWFPGAPPVGAFILVGMGGFFAGVAKVPLTALIMVSEMSGSYHLLVPLMLVSFVHVAVLSAKWSLYEEQVHSLIDSPAHFGDFVIDILENIRIREIWDPGRRPILIPQSTPLPQVLRMVADSSYTVFPVVDDEHRLAGVFSLHDLRSVLAGDGAGNLIVAADIARPPTSLKPDDNLHSALRVMRQRQLEEVPVVSSTDPSDIVCMLRQEEILNAYDARIHAMRSENHQYG